jgi:flavodoxin
MNSVVIYASRSGNTRRVAEAIADVLGQAGAVAVYPVESAPVEFGEADLVAIGGPTEGHGMTPAVKEYLTRLPMANVARRAVAAFDTRLAWPLILSGSAAAGIADRLRELGGDLVVAPESFIVDRTPALKPGELERAATWASDVVALMAGRTPLTAGV